MQCLSQYCGQVGPSEGSTIFFITCSCGKISYQDEKLLPVIQAINYFEQSMDLFSSWCLPRKQLLGFCSNLNREKCLHRKYQWFNKVSWPHISRLQDMKLQDDHSGKKKLL